MPNTKEGRDGKCCICAAGFTTEEDLFADHGCWKCSKKCHPFSKCIFPGKCQCTSGFAGDGIHQCKNPIPVLIKLSKRELLSNGETLLTISYQNDDIINSTASFKPTNFFCQLGYTILKAKHFTQTEIQCQIPKTLKGNLPLSISYDSYHWSNDELLLKFDNTGNIEEIIDAIPFLLTLLFSMLVGVVWFYGKSLFFKAQIIDEDNLPTIDQ